jgi:hypothetical protein
MNFKLRSVFLILFWLLSVQLMAQFQNATIDTLRLAPIEAVGDSAAYELMIFEPGFESWFNRVNRPEWYYSESYLESWNQKLANQWNALLHQPRRSSCMPTTYLDYDWRISYGLTLNYRLFYYFRYMQEHCNIFANYPARW